MRKIIILSVTALLIVLATACKKEKDDTQPTPAPTTIPENMTGLGDYTGAPSGTQFVLPDYVSIIGNIYGGLNYNKKYKNKFQKYISTAHSTIAKNTNEEIFLEYSSGTYVDLYIKFLCTVDHDTTLVIPGGMIFVDSSGTFQNGFILQSTTIPLFAMDTTFAFVHAYCLNLGRHGSDYEAVYRPGPVTNNASLLEVVNIMKNKQVPVGNEYLIQNILWNITDYEGLTNADRDSLNALP